MGENTPRVAPWSFYSTALQRILSDGWQQVSGDWSAKLVSAVRDGNTTEAKRLSTDTPNLSTGFRELINKPVDAVLLAAQRKARTHWEKRLNAATGAKQKAKKFGLLKVVRHKADPTISPENLLTSPEEYSALLWSTHAEQIKRIAENFPDRILDPELQRLIDFMPLHDTARVIDLEEIALRVERLLLAPTPWDRLSTVEVARLWNADGLLLAQDNGMERCQIIAVMDQITCPVCIIMHGQEVMVNQGAEKIQSSLNLEDPGEYMAAWQFPRFYDIQLKTPDEITQMNLMPPFHPHCRCSVRFLYGGGGTVSAASGA